MIKIFLKIDCHLISYISGDKKNYLQKIHMTLATIIPEYIPIITCIKFGELSEIT